MDGITSPIHAGNQEAHGDGVYPVTIGISMEAVQEEQVEVQVGKVLVQTTRKAGQGI